MDRLTRTIFDFCNLRADIDSCALVDSAEILSRAMAIDSELAGFASSLTASFSYTTIVRSNKDQSFRVDDDFPHLRHNQVFHIYQSIWACNVLNNYRITRIFVNEIILRRFRSAAMQAGPSHDDDDDDEDRDFRGQTECHQALELMRQLATDICSSVPYKLGSVSTGDDNDEPTLQQTPTLVTTGGGITLLLPLFVAGIVDGSAGSTCGWAIECLGMIGRMTGVNMALTLRDLLQHEPGMMSRTDIISSDADRQRQEQRNVSMAAA